MSKMGLRKLKQPSYFTKFVGGGTVFIIQTASLINNLTTLQFIFLYLYIKWPSSYWQHINFLDGHLHSLLAINIITNAATKHIPLCMYVWIIFTLEELKIIKCDIYHYVIYYIYVLMAYYSVLKRKKTDAFYNMEEPWGQWSKQVTKGQTLFNFTYLRPME